MAAMRNCNNLLWEFGKGGLGLVGSIIVLILAIPFYIVWFLGALLFIPTSMVIEAWDLPIPCESCLDECV
jgi:hypothetical protein